MSDFHDYEPNLEFDDSDLLQQKHPENDDELELPEVDRQHTPNTYIESPMSGNAVIYLLLLFLDIYISRWFHEKINLTQVSLDRNVQILRGLTQQ